MVEIIILVAYAATAAVGSQSQFSRHFKWNGCTRGMIFRDNDHNDPRQQRSIVQNPLQIPRQILTSTVTLLRRTCSLNGCGRARQDNIMFYRRWSHKYALPYIKEICICDYQQQRRRKSLSQKR